MTALPLSTVPAATPTQAAIYARVSTLKQGEDWHTSLKVQVKECLAFADRHGLTADPACIITEPYTATTLDRPAFERLLNDMVRRGIRHLIMDKPDRVTREGQATAGYFIYRLRDLGITLHLALGNFSVNNDMTVNLFLSFAFAAKLENDQRVANIQRTRREAASSLGRYVKGNRPPYGWRVEPLVVDSKGQAVTFRLVHDAETYPSLLRILRERQAGWSYRQIASGLTADGIPTSAAYAGLRNAAGKEWHQSSVKIIVRDPINAGIVTGFRSRTVEAPPDARHAKKWSRQVPVPASEQIVLPSDLVVDPPLTPDEYRWLLSPQAGALRVDGAHRKASDRSHPTQRPRG
jgi:DNA invertase Pin-like site-specific DNA recombinase